MYQHLTAIGYGVVDELKGFFEMIGNLHLGFIVDFDVQVID